MLFFPTMKGLSDCDKYFATPSPAAPTPVPTPVPTLAPTSGYVATMSPTSYFTESPGATPSPTYGRVTGDFGDDDGTPAPVVRPAIRYSVETTAHEWCPKVPLSECVVDYEGVESGDVRSLHASFYVGSSGSSRFAYIGVLHLNGRIVFRGKMKILLLFYQPLATDTEAARGK